MGFYLSPWVHTNEYDASISVPGLATSIAAIVMRGTYKGQEYIPTYFTTYEEMINEFGYANVSRHCSYKNSDDYKAAEGYLKRGSSLYAVRVMPSGATFAGVKCSSTTSAGTSAATWTQFTSDNAFKLDSFSTNLTEDFPDACAEEQGAHDPFWIIAAYRGLSGNKIRVAIVDKKGYDLCHLDSSIVVPSNSVAPSAWGDPNVANSGWQIYQKIARLDSPLETQKDFIVIVQECPQGLNASVESNWLDKEIWNVSTEENAYDEYGLPKFVEKVINLRSKYIRFALSELFVNRDLPQNESTQPSYLATAKWKVLGGGVDSQDEFNVDTISDAAIIDGYDTVADPETIDINILIDGNKSMTVKNYLDSIARQLRKDCVAVLDCYRDDIFQKGYEATNLRDWRHGVGTYANSLESALVLNSSYSTCVANWGESYDKYNRQYIWHPLSGDVAGIIAHNDYIAEPWYAPAGLNRGEFLNIRRFAFYPNKSQRDIIYAAGLNPATIVNSTKVLWGQKTLLDKNSAFNRLNVRRLFLTVEKAIASISKYFIFENNNSITRRIFLGMVDPYLADIQARQGVYGYKIVCDDSNNTAERIDRNEFWADFYLKPTRSSEFLILNFIATKTGANFSEVVGISGTDIAANLYL